MIATTVHMPCRSAGALSARASARQAPSEIAAYTGLHAAVVGGSAAEIERLVRTARTSTPATASAARR